MARTHEDFVDIVKIKNPSVEIVGIYTKAQDNLLQSRRSGTCCIPRVGKINLNLNVRCLIDLVPPLNFLRSATLHSVNSAAFIEFYPI